jgi:hypothetical protein
VAGDVEVVNVPVPVVADLRRSRHCTDTISRVGRAADGASKRKAIVGLG